MLAGKQPDSRLSDITCSCRVQVRPSVVDQFPDADFGTIGRIVGDTWKASSETEKLVTVAATEYALHRSRALLVYYCSFLPTGSMLRSHGTGCAVVASR